MEVRRIESRETKDFIMNKHYAQRLPSISFAFGLFIDEKLEGICTIGKPASNTLCFGVCGAEYSSKVYELNRLVINEGMPPNTLSQFVGKVLKLLKEEDLILVSYADSGIGHCGYIYQATNWIYTGSSKERTDKYSPDNKHSRHYTEEYAHLRKVRTSKHRYIYFTGKSKKIYLSHLNYEIEPYPKKENSRYELGDRIKTKIINTRDGIVFYE